jgi:DNA (cytosine-5)-methyltransferase 1
MPLSYLSVCSGIEAASVAWGPLGFEPVAFAEIEAFPSAVLKHHYPTVPNWGDMSKFKDWPDANVDVLVGGTPCQSFSVAGLRKGLDDPRGNLALTYLAVLDRYRPEWMVWENVPGVLSSGGGRDFGSFLGGLAALGYGFAYRVLDAQYFGVPQRRQRVFVVGCARDWRRAAAVLFERESLSGHSAEVSPGLIRGRGKRLFGCFDTRGVNAFDRADLDNLLFNYERGGVRRPTPLEVERSFGFPDNYTAIGYRGKPVKDGQRYKALGNSMAVPVMSWIGRRIKEVDSLDVDSGSEVSTGCTTE